MQLWQPCSKIFHKNPEIFRWMSEKDEKNILLENFVFPQNFFMDTYNAALTTLPWNFSQKSGNSSLNIQKWWKSIFFQKERFSICCHGYVECSFDNSAENFLAQCPKRINIFFSEESYLKVFRLTRRLQFCLLCWELSDKKPKFYAQCSKMIIKNWLFFPKNVFQYVDMDT